MTGIGDAAEIYADLCAAVRHWDKELRSQRGVTFVQAMIINAIDRCIVDGPWPRPVDISRTLHVEPQTLTGSIDRLEKLGLVRRERHETDRRGYRLVLTEAGLDTAEELREVRL